MKTKQLPILLFLLFSALAGFAQSHHAQLRFTPGTYKDTCDCTVRDVYDHSDHIAYIKSYRNGTQARTALDSWGGKFEDVFNGPDSLQRAYQDILRQYVQGTDESNPNRQKVK